ncbi:MAG: TIGR02147 family protein [Fibrobacterales bacterium]
MSSTINIYDYWSSQLFIKDWFDDKKKNSPSFSFQFFANKGGFRSRSIISNVLTGKRNITIESLLKWAKLLSLNTKETRYFEVLIQYSTVTTDTDQEYYRDLLLSLKPARTPYILERLYTEYHENWFVAPIREIITMLDFNDDFKLLGSSLKPALTVQQAKNAINLLLKLNLIERHEKGARCYYTQKESSIETPPYLPKSISIRNNQKKFIELGGQAIERFQKEERNILSATLALNEQGVSDMNKLIRDFKNKMIKIADQCEGKTNKVYQTNIQLFPLSTLIKK